MNYVREELLRQQALLVILLTGQQLQPAETERERDTGPETETGWAAVPSGRTRQRVMGEESSLPLFADGTAETSALRATLEADGVRRQQLAEAESSAAPASRRKDQRPPEAPGAVGVDPLGPQMAAAGLFGQFPAESGEVRLVTELRQAAEYSGADPEALSRAFQRDARRYDGGFRLY